MDARELKPIIEALLLAADTPLTIERIASVFDNAEKSLVRDAINELSAEYDERAGGISIDRVGGGYRLRTRPIHAVWIRRLMKSGPPRVSGASMETLAIVAYKQPLTRGDIEAVRGVDCSGVLKKLMDRRLVKIVGRKDAPGRPALYGTTREFLEAFDLKDIASLPSLKEMEADPEADDLFGLNPELELNLEGRPEGHEDETDEGGDGFASIEDEEAGDEGPEEEGTDEPQGTAKDNGRGRDSVEARIREDDSGGEGQA